MTPTKQTTDPQGMKESATPDDNAWVAFHVPRFKEVRQNYIDYEGFLKVFLNAACLKLAPLSIIEARTKSVPSFAEKILRKRKLYENPNSPYPPDPLVRVTDLCGGRVITKTSAQVYKVCKFIEQAFDIDWLNSEDVSLRLQPTEFGYRSVHYIVSINADKLKSAEIPANPPQNILGLKAEIQVRTVLEHVWADIGHDMTYKTEVKVPANIRRHFAALAAVLEGADREFDRLIHAFDVFKSNFGAYHKRKVVEDEIERLLIVLSFDPDNLELVEKIARLALSIGKHEEAVKILKPYLTRPQQGIQRAYGVALTELYWDQPRGRKYRKGRKYLKHASLHPDTDSETICAYADSLVYENPSKAREHFHRAVSLDPTDPVTLCRYLEFEVEHSTNNTVVLLAAPMIRDSMDRCRKQIEAIVNVPWAWSSLATFHLLLDEPFEALMATAQVVSLCGSDQAADRDTAACKVSGRPCAAGLALLRMRDTLKRIECLHNKIDGFDWVERVVHLGLSIRLNNAEAQKTISELASWKGNKPHVSKEDKVLILSGGCAPEMQSAINRLSPHMVRACKGLSLNLFCGGTTAGISYLGGDLALKSNEKIKAFGYLPKYTPPYAQVDKDTSRYCGLIRSSGTDFTPLDPLQGWTDIVAAGVEPCRVKALSYCGGRISQTECAVGLALGARVGVVEDPAIPEDRQFNEPNWRDHPSLIRLPMDAMTIRAFLLIDELGYNAAYLTEAAKQAHKDYVSSAVPKEPSLLPWEDLPEDLRASNYHQVAYALSILECIGLGVRPITEPDKPIFNIESYLSDKGLQINELAEMEHGRWNVERLLLGWRYADTKDVLNKRSPYLAPWDALPPDIQKYDFDIIRTLPGKFKAAGLEIYPLDVQKRG
jgi:ppGpp synthetase/RelA/SpoT-type nucleotidyltranferase